MNKFRENIKNEITGHLVNQLGVVTDAKRIATSILLVLENMKVTRNVLGCFYEDDLPSKFIAIYSDGSGCDIYYEDGEGSEFYIGCGRGVNGVQKDWFVDAGYLWFVPLPDDFEVWEDQKENISSKIHDKG